MKPAVVVLISSFLYLAGCNSTGSDSKSDPSFNTKAEKEGYHLALKHCRSCHQFPPPELLDKKTWFNFVLPKMGGLFGFRHFESHSYFDNNDSSSVMSLKDWNNIVKYYVRQAPDTPLHRTTGSKLIKIGLPGFVLEAPVFNLKSPATTFVGIFPEKKERLVFGDGLTQHIYTVSADNRLEDSFFLRTGISHVSFNALGLTGLAMGVMHPSDERSGLLARINISDINTSEKAMPNLLQPKALKGEPDKVEKKTIIFDSLQRPVYAEYANLNNDTLEDIIICEFGNTTGQLSWFENKGAWKFDRHVLRALPGAVRTAISDFNKDGYQDIISLMAQGDEGMFIYYNKGNGSFTEQRILQFSPSHGSNYFELADFNKDGFPDIITTNGDNGDYPPVLKAYHGIRIYLNDGRNNFKQHIFLPVNGVGKAVARDFDLDGDVDIASIAYFPDYDNIPEESFIYWQNAGNLSFQPYSFNGATAGRWLTMDAGDIDADGDMDIVLGNAKFTLGRVPKPLMQKWDEYSPSIVILYNTLHKARY